MSHSGIKVVEIEVVEETRAQLVAMEQLVGKGVQMLLGGTGLEATMSTQLIPFQLALNSPVEPTILSLLWQLPSQKIVDLKGES